MASPGRRLVVGEAQNSFEKNHRGVLQRIWMCCKTASVGRLTQIAALTILSACSSSSNEGSDAGPRTDGFIADSGTGLDSGPPDGGSADSRPVDADVRDLGPSDTGSSEIDTGSSDGGIDSGPMDSGLLDGAEGDASDARFEDAAGPSVT